MTGDGELKPGMETAIACIRCGQTMVVRQNRKNKSWFLGCSDYPYCKSTRPISVDLEMKLRGAPSLFDEPPNKL